MAFPNIRVLIKAIAVVHRGLYRMSGGRVGASLAGKPMLLLTTRGRKSGRERTTPLLYHREGEDFIVVASNGGDPRYPAWYLNLRSDPMVRVQVGGRRVVCLAQVATPEERARLWPALLVRYPGYNDYEKRVGREIPLVVLRPQP